ncbi:hypothetical protein CWI36_0171p0030 [Hamiltosporidium magnivora]|uniref:Uncharacterized protein n=1 Tax=Hamiltosporidium magnivora TaxID=148818 RepID=A0A4Q9LKX2_9MICR|nr:hypothetical protein CWI36_0171p0030 [Hamiltosporidium magnivora]
MKNNERRELTRFYDLIKRKDYKKIEMSLNTISKINATAISDPKDLDLLKQYTKNKEILKIIMRNDIKFLLCNKRKIHKEMINTVLYLDNAYIKEIKDIIIDNIIIQKYENYVYSMKSNIRKLCELKKAIDWFENSLDSLRLNESDIPPQWNLEGEFVFKFCVLTKQIICNIIFHNNIDNKDYLDGLKYILEFEKKYCNHIFSDNCCENNNNTNNDKNKKIIFKNTGVELVEDNKSSLNDPLDVETDTKITKKDLEDLKKNCKHRKMLSQIFIPYIEIYVKFLFIEARKIEMDQSKKEMKIVCGFIEFFRIIGEIFLEIQYFESEKIYEYFLAEVNSIAIRFIEKIEHKRNFKEAVLILNTFSYVESTSVDLFKKIYEKNNKICCENVIQKELRLKEAQEYTFIDKYYQKYFKQLELSDKNLKFSEFLSNFLQNEIFGADLLGISEDVMLFLLELSISFIFSKIMFLKLNTSKAEQLLFEVSDFKNIHRNKLIYVPLISMLEKYLKIFLCNPNDTETFITNFFHFSSGSFSFSQIISVLEDAKNNVNLFVRYKVRVKDKNK